MLHIHHTLKVFLLLFLVAGVKSFGQTAIVDSANQISYKNTTIKYRKLQLGILANVNRMRFTETPDQNYTINKRFGLGAGIHAQYNLKKNIAFTLNCLYETKKWESHYNGGGSNKYNFNTIHSVTIPILFKYSPTKRSFFLAGGPYLGVIMKKQVKGYGEGNYLYNNAFEIGAALGLGFNIPIDNRISCIIEVRDYLNLNNSKVLGNYSKMNTATLQLGFFYKFGKTEEVIIKKIIDTVWKKEKKVFVKLFYSPHYSYRTRNSQEVRYGKYSQYDYAGHGSSYFVYDPAIEIPKMTSEFGVLIELALSKHLNVTIGSTLNHEGYTTKKSDFTIYSESQMTYTSILYKDTTMLQNQSINFDYYFLTAPFILNYQHKIKKHLYYIGMGVQPQILTKHNLQFSDAEKYNYLLKNNDLSEEKKVRYIEAIALFYSANLGVAFSLGDKLFLFIEPDCKIEIGRISKTPGIWSAGCKIGVKF